MGTSKVEKLTESSVVVASEHQTSAQVDGEEVVLDLERGIYYGLNAMGSQIWSMIQSPSTVGEVIDAIVEEYDVSREQCADDVVAYLHDLEDSGLVEVTES